MIASRHDPSSLVPAARALYAAGKRPHEVVAAIYGVELPREAFVFHRDYVDGDKPLRAVWKTHPWELMTARPSFQISDTKAAEEARAFAQVPHVLVLGSLTFADLPLGFSTFGYDLNELAAGRSTVVALARPGEVPATDAQLLAMAPSLLDMFHEMTRLYHASFRGLTSTHALEERSNAAEELRHLQLLKAELAT